MVKIKKGKKNLKTVSFDEEVVTKDSANKFKELKSETENLDNHNVENENGNGLNSSDERLVIKNGKTKRKKTNKSEIRNENNNEDQGSVSDNKVKRAKRKIKSNEELNFDEGVTDKIQNEHVDESEKKTAKRKKKNKVNKEEKLGETETTEEVSVENPNVKKGESIRAQKKKKHAKLLEDKRLKSELVSQQNCLNYLSKWKHCRSEWKFEKLKQIWLQQNLFDSSKVPDEFWDTAIEYFNGSKGFIRKVVLRDAVKIIEKEESTEEENADENYALILKRARDVIQTLQE